MNTAQEIRSRGEKLLTSLLRERFLNLTGIKHGSDSAAIFSSNRDFEEPGLFHSLNEIPAEGREIRTRNHLLRAFLANSFIGAGTSAATDKILTFWAAESIRAGRKTIPLRSAEAEIINEPKKHRRDEIALGREQKLNQIMPAYRLRLDTVSMCSETLGFPDYNALRAAIDRLNPDYLTGQAGQFLKNTDYISNDMLGWFFSRKMNIDIEDATFFDMAYLFNSEELRGYFPKRDLMSLAMPILEEIGLKTAMNIRLDTVKRKGKTVDGLFFPLNPPLEAAVSIYPVGSVRDYESFLDSLGASLCYGFTEPDQDFEIKFLREDALVRTFSELFKNLLFEPKWLKKYLRLDSDRDFISFLYLRRLISVRVNAGRVLYEAELYRNPGSGDLPGAYSQIIGNAARCSVSENDYLSDIDICSASASRFKGVLAGINLGGYLRETFDEEWWRVPAAAEFLKSVWREGGLMTTKHLSDKIRRDNPNEELLSRVFEQVLS
ncbi:MAG: hypothetical protein RIG61_10330 [Deltaproteobacteria bacterium]